MLRGLPGSGKSTLARQMVGYRHFEADMFLEIDGVYRYDAAKVRSAHDWCLASTKKALVEGHDVVVSNTFVKLWELHRYVELGFKFQIFELNLNWPNIHGVSEDKIKIMAEAWQELPSGWMCSIPMS